MGKDRLSLRYLLKRKYRVAPLPLVQDQLGEWFDEGFGQRLYQRQKDCCAQNLKSYFGYRLCQLGISPRHSLLENLQPSHKFILSRAHSEASCQCDFDALPLPSDTIDIVLLHHVLDFSSHPHQSLIEAARLVTAGGHIVIIGFNPLSLFGLYKWLGAVYSDKAVWRHNSLRRSRIVDWLQLLGFQVSYRSLDGDKPTGEQLKPWKKILNRQDLSRGASYMIVAQKMVTPLRPIKARYWSPLKVGSLVGLKQVQAEDRGAKKKELKQ
ncbi:MAG: methyltransferase domain-containing protein [Gammaproteobacteria bacterium]|nr:methyltransferase domain-containing protein [Gammaproteobacteria bacterium]MBQ0838960.1 methyltransferase domain-containing protein [Gammaproteobacteria bacterium]